jgi:hypothetical protein
MPDSMGQAWVFDAIEGWGVCVSAGSAPWNLVLKELDGFILLERIDDGSFRISNQQRTDILGVKLQGYYRQKSCSWVSFLPEIRYLKRCHGFPIKVVSNNLSYQTMLANRRRNTKTIDFVPTILQTGQTVVQTRVRYQGNYMARRSIICDQVVFFQAENSDIVFTVHNNKLVGAELEFFDWGRSRRHQGYADSFLTKDVDLPWAKSGFIGTDSEEGLNGIIGHHGDLGVDAIAGKL